MLDKYLNPTPTFYKWDRFWVGALPALVAPFVGVIGVFLIAFLNAKYNQHEDFTPHMFLVSLQSKTAFMRISSLCCMLNGFVFFYILKISFEKKCDVHHPHFQKRTHHKTGLY